MAKNIRTKEVYFEGRVYEIRCPDPLPKPTPFLDSLANAFQGKPAPESAIAGPAFTKKRNNFQDAYYLAEYQGRVIKVAEKILTGKQLYNMNKQLRRINGTKNLDALETELLFYDLPEHLREDVIKIIEHETNIKRQNLKIFCRNNTSDMPAYIVTYRTHQDEQIELFYSEEARLDKVILLEQLGIDHYPIAETRLFIHIGESSNHFSPQPPTSPPTLGD